MRLKYLGVGERLDDDKVAQLQRMQLDTFGEIMMSHTETVFHHWWHVMDEDEPVAFCSLYIYPDLPETAFLSLSGVLPSHRGKRIQKKMIKHRVKFARSQGVKRLISYTSYDNLASANSLIGCGFRLYDPQWKWGVTNALYFQRML